MDKQKKLKEIFENDPLGLLNIKPASTPAKNEDERLVASFQEINDFYETHNREPEPGNDMQEYMLYCRLKGLREDESKSIVLGYNRAWLGHKAAYSFVLGAASSVTRASAISRLLFP